MQKGFEEEVPKRRSLSALLDESRLRSSVVSAGGIFGGGRRRRRRRRRRLTSDFNSEEEEEDEDEDENEDEEEEEEEEEEDEENEGDFANVVERQHNYNLTDRKSYSLPHGWRSANRNDNESASDSLMATFIRGEPLVKSDRCIKSDVVERGMKTLRLTVKSEERRMRLRVNVNPNEFRRRRDLMVQWFQEFGDEQKNILLKELMKNCGTPQNHLLSVAIEPVMHLECPPNCQDFLTWLPKPLSLYIVCFLDPVSLSQCSKVCRAWHSLTNHSFLWQRFCTSPQWQLSSPEVELKQLAKCRLPDGSVHWKKVFSERFRLFRNWMKGYCHVRTFEGHTQGISCVQFDDTRIVSGSSDKTIKVWNIRTNSRWSVMTLVGHSGTVRCLHLEGNRLVSGSTDCSIKVWDLSSNSGWSSIACKVTMVGHRDTVRCLQVDDEKVVSGSYDKTLKVWDGRTGECKLTLRGHEGAVLCVQHDETKIVSGSCDRTIKIWNFIPGVCINTLHGHHDAVTCLQFDSHRIISGSLDRTIKFWNLITGHCLSTLDWMKSEGHTGVIRCLQADRWRIVSAGDDKTLKIWSLETGQRLVTLKNHTDGVTCLQFNDYVIVSGSYDKTVKLWDFSVC